VEPKARNCGGVDDDNCNGIADREEPECQCPGGGAPGTTRACNGHPGYDGKGVCTAGSQTCVGKISISEWSPCSGDVGPSAEGCDGFDRNCNNVAGINEPGPPPPAGTMNCAVVYACPAPDRGPLYYRTGIGFTNYAGSATLWTAYAPRGNFAAGTYPPGTRRIAHDNTGTKMGPIEVATACCPSGCPGANIYYDSNGQFFTP